MKRYLDPLLQRRTYLATLDLLFDLPFAILWFTFFTTVTSVGFGMVITLIGIPILTFAMLAARFAGTVERRRVELFYSVHIDEPACAGRR
jgi:Putative sensor